MVRPLWGFVLTRVRKVNPSLLLLLVLILGIGLMNWLLIGQRLVLYLFYAPVLVAAWYFPKRDAISAALLAGVIVVAWALVSPAKLAPPTGVPGWLDLGVWGGMLVVTAYLVVTLQDAARKAFQNLERAYAGALAILSKLIQIADADTEAHAVRVSMWAVRIAKAYKADFELIEEIRIAGLLHDVGKAEVGADLLRKAAALSGPEREQLEAPATYGAGLIRPVGGMLTNVADAIEAHHEKYDGSGYKRLKGEQIPLVARIIAVADALDALLYRSTVPQGRGVV